MLERFAATLHAQPVLLIFLVIGLGYLIGNIRVRGVSLGPVGGVLFAGLAFGHFGYRLSPDAQALGFALFIFSVGYEAGVAVTTPPVLIGYPYGRKVLGLNPVLLLGGITGSMTSGASLSIVTKAAKSNAPALGYTGAYAFANILLTIAGSVILLL